MDINVEIRREHHDDRSQEVGMKRGGWLACMLLILVVCLPGQGPEAAWQPQKPIEFIVPAGPGGGADVMARFIAPLVSKYNLSPQPLVAINKSGGGRS
jgi:tripartite-type tricarboxylate transporter receptor subunit TctC